LLHGKIYPEVYDKACKITSHAQTLHTKLTAALQKTEDFEEKLANMLTLLTDVVGMLRDNEGNTDARLGFEIDNPPMDTESDESEE